MEVEKKSIIGLIENKNEYFHIPFYQRKYTWNSDKEGPVNALWNDLIDFYNEPKESKDENFFLGTVIIKKTNNIKSELILVDGQQRITTIIILVAALRDFTSSNSNKNYEKLNWTFEEWLENENDKFKLDRISDYEIIEKIINKKVSDLTKKDKKSNYYKNYDFFTKKLETLESDYEIDIKTFKDEILKKIELVVINLNSGENEYKVFESINSKGISLSAADLIKNFIYMHLKNEQKIIKEFENNFLKYFNELEKNNKSSDELINFYRQIFAIETGQLFSKKGLQIYQKFYEKFNEKFTITEDLLEYTKSLIKEKYIHEYISTTNDFKSDLYPLLKANFWNFYALMHVIVKHNCSFDKYEEINVTSSQKENIYYAFKFLSKLIVFRTLKSFGRVESNRDYAKLSYKLNKELNENKNSSFKEIFDNVVIKELEDSTSNNRIPSIDEINNDIEQKQIINLYENKTTLKYILLAIDEYLSEYNNKFSDEQIKIAQIEHIIPQKFDKNKNYDYLNNDQKNEIKKLINTLGNLAIINPKANKKASNKSVDEKIKLYDKYSYFKINTKLSEMYKNKGYIEWTLKDIWDNAKRISKYIFEIWQK